MRKFLTWIKGSLENNDKGASARKLAAFTIIACIVIAHTAWLKYAFMHENFSLLCEVLLIDFGFVSVSLGMATYENIMKYKNGKTDKTDTTVAEP